MIVLFLLFASALAGEPVKVRVDSPDGCALANEYAEGSRYGYRWSTAGNRCRRICRPPNIRLQTNPLSNDCGPPSEQQLIDLARVAEDGIHRLYAQAHAVDSTVSGALQLDDGVLRKPDHRRLTVLRTRVRSYILVLQHAILLTCRRSYDRRGIDSDAVIQDLKSATDDLTEVAGELAELVNKLRARLERLEKRTH